MNKVYLQGYYGHNNLGDDYLFYSIVDNISSSNQEYLITIDTENTMIDGKLCTGVRKVDTQIGGLYNNP